MGYRLIEHKTTSSDIGIGSVYWKTLSIDPQISAYFEGALSLGFDCTDVLYDVLRRPAQQPQLATPPEARKYTKATKTEPSRLYASQREVDETPDEFEHRVFAAIGEDPERYYQRGTVVRLESERREAQFDMWQTAGAIRDARRLNVWPRNPDACMQWSRACDYFDVCTGTARIDDPLLFEKRIPHEELDVRQTKVKTVCPNGCVFDLGPRHDGKSCPECGSDLLSGEFSESVDRRSIVTQSSIRCFRACDRRYYFRYELGIRSIASAKPLRVGRRIHSALEVWWKSGGDLTASLAALDPRPDEPPVTPDRLYDRARERAMMVGYHLRWQAPPKGFVAVEREFVTDLVNPETGAASRSFRFAGRLDGVCEAP